MIGQTISHYAIIEKLGALNVVGKPWAVVDAQHFVMIQPTHPDPPGTELYLIQNWSEELKRLCPTGKK